MMMSTHFESYADGENIELEVLEKNAGIWEEDTVSIESAYDDNDHPAKIIERYVRDGNLIIEVEVMTLYRNNNKQTQSYIYDAKGENKWRELPGNGNPIDIHNV